VRAPSSTFTLVLVVVVVIGNRVVANCQQQQRD
jgi:hypothetical protein